MPTQTPEQKQASYAAAGLQMPSIGTPAITPVMDATKIGVGATPLVIRPTTETPIPNIANLIGTDTTAAPVAPVAPTPKAPGLADRLSSSLAGLFGQTKNKEADLASSIEAETAPYNQQLNELNTQIKMLQANALTHQDKAMQSGETLGFATREAQNVQRTDAIEALKLSALAEGMRGNIALAEKHATNAINAKYAQINSDIEKAKTQIYDNYDSFSAAEKKKADLALLKLDKDDIFAKTKMEEEKTIQGILQLAIKQSQENGKPVPTLILQQANKLTDPTQVTALLAPYLTDAAKVQKALDDHRLNLAQIDASRASAEHSRAETANINNPANKPATQAQQTVSNYASRIVQANEILTKTENDIRKLGAVSYAVAKNSPNYLQPSTVQVYEQAKRNFLNAVLRQESGAVISPSEFAEGDKQYFAQPGESDEVVANKQANRALVERNFIKASGNAYEAPPASLGKVLPGDQVPGGKPGEEYKDNGDGTVTRIK